MQLLTSHGLHRIPPDFLYVHRLPLSEHSSLARRDLGVIDACRTACEPEFLFDPLATGARHTLS
jgi:hypothetical protein